MVRKPRSSLRERDGADAWPVLTSGVVRGPTAASIARALAMGLLVAGCARLADLGAGSDTAAVSPNTEPGSEGRTDGNIEITPATLDFGAVPCGTEGESRLITIHNKGGLPVPYKAQVPAGSSFRIDGELEGTLAPKGRVTLDVFVNPRTAGENSADLFVTAGAALQPIRATAKGSGPTIEIAQSTIAFGDVRKENGGAPVDVAVKNSGTEALSISTFISSHAAFEVVWPGKPVAFTVPPNGTTNFKVVLVSAASDDSAPLSATIKPSTTKFCGAPPLLTVTGRRFTSEVTLSPVDFGRQACNTTPGARNIVVTNYANKPVNFSLTPATNTAFTFDPPVGGVVALAPTSGQPQSANIKVTPKLLGNTAPLLDIKELLGVTLTSEAPNVSGRRDVPLHVETRGAILTITPVALAFTSNGTTTDTKTFNVANTGNESIFLTWTFARPSGNGAGAWAYSPPGNVNAGGANDGSVDFKAPAAEGGPFTATLTPQQFFLGTAAICKALVPVTMTGTKP
jgi:hypothetical protein